MVDARMDAGVGHGIVELLGVRVARREEGQHEGEEPDREGAERIAHSAPVERDGTYGDQGEAVERTQGPPYLIWFFMAASLSLSRKDPLSSHLPFSSVWRMEALRMRFMASPSCGRIAVLPMMR